MFVNKKMSVYKSILEGCLIGFPLGISIGFGKYHIEEFAKKRRIKNDEKWSRNRVLEGKL